jgi:hypothetical protein
LRLASDSDESFESDNDANENQTHSVDNVEEDPGKKPGNPLEGHSSTSSRTSSDEALSEGKIFTDSSISHEDQVQVVDAEVAPETSYSVAVPVSPTPSLDSAAQAFSAEGSPWSEGCIAFIRFKKCSSCPSGFRRMTTAARNHQDKEHRGEKHPFVIVKIIQEDDGSTPRVQGYTGTTLGQRGRLSRKERKDYLSLEGGQNRFISCIENGQRIRSQEEPDLFIQGKEKMSRETYIEFRDLKSFPIDQLILYNNKLLQLEPESLDKLLNIV